MRAVILPGNGLVSVVEREVPRPEADQLLVRVVGAGCNRADLLQRDGLYPAPPGAPADIPGLEFSGVVEAVGHGVLKTRPGDRVMGITGGGAQAEFLRIREDICVPVPDTIDLLAAAAIPEAYFAAFEALVRQGSVYPGATVFVNAAGSGVGTAVVQLAKALGARVVGTTRTAAKLERLWSLGLDAGIVASGDETSSSRAERIRDEIGGEVDISVDLLGGEHLGTALEVLRTSGTAVVLGAVAGTVSPVSIPLIIARRLTIRATALRGRPDYEKASLSAVFERNVLPFLRSGMAKPVLDQVLDLDEAEPAYKLLEEGKAFGKIVLATANSE